MIETHAHLNFEDFKDDYTDVLQRSFDNGIKAIINVGSNFKTSQRACEIARNYIGKNVYAAIGLHPIHVLDEDFNEEKYKALIKEYEGLVRAIGETGFDFFHQEAEEKQKEVFKKHLNLAQEFSLPVILHSRGGKKEPLKPYLKILEIFESLSFKPKGVLHCFSAGEEIAEKFLAKGFYIGLGGIITFSTRGESLPALRRGAGGGKNRKTIEKIPLERIVLETDSPYLAPEEVRGTRNEPKNLFYIAKKLAEIKREPLSKIVKITEENAKKLFKI